MTAHQRRSLAVLLVTTAALASLTGVVLQPGAAEEKKETSQAGKPDLQKGRAQNSAERRAGKPVLQGADDEVPVKMLVTGQAVLLSEALQRRKIKAYAEETKGQVVLETAAGELLPLVPDWRGRALFQDERLRNRKLTLLVHRRKSVPYLQVLSVYTYNEAGQTQLTDYWCDICAIPMFEIKKCECCQGPTRLRFQKKELPALIDAK